MSTRVADYFFVAGLHDSHLIPTFESAKKHQRIADNDVSYYQRQEQAVAGHDEYANTIVSAPSIDTSRRCGQSLPVGPTEPSATLRSTFPEVATSASLLGVLDHVQSVIDNFDKERDTARDNVIAVHEPLSRHTEKYKATEAETFSNNRTTSYPTEATRRLSVREVSARKWRSPSDPKICKNNKNRIYLLTNNFFKAEATKRSLSTKRVKSIETVPSIPSEPEIIPNIFDIRYTPTILMRYPKINYSSKEPFPAYAAMVRQKKM